MKPAGGYFMFSFPPRGSSHAPTRVAPADYTVCGLHKESSYVQIKCSGAPPALQHRGKLSHVNFAQNSMHRGNCVPSPMHTFRTLLASCIYIPAPVRVTGTKKRERIQGNPARSFSFSSRIELLLRTWLHIRVC